ncbi:Dinucleoside triphosphate hydrolase [Elasticomyces elasticus]|nr:Dinucleoside triphosphate hydrolase [Elasticomyces elasticus]
MASFPGRVINFGSLNVTSQVFHITKHSFALVNLKPLLPGHILVSPLAVKPKLSDLTQAEITDLFLTVTHIQRTLQRLYKADAFNIAVQDGEAAGQSVPHVHCHVIPRTTGDAGGDDKVHEWLEGEEGDVGRHQRDARNGNNGEREVGQWAKDGDRKARSMDEMEREAKWLRDEVEKDGVAEASALATIATAAPTATAIMASSMAHITAVPRTAGDAAIPVDVVSTRLITDGDGKECLIWHVKQVANVFSPECKEWGPDDDASTTDGQMLELRSVKLADQTKTCAGWYVELHDGHVQPICGQIKPSPSLPSVAVAPTSTIVPTSTVAPLDFLPLPVGPADDLLILPRDSDFNDLRDDAKDSPKKLAFNMCCKIKSCEMPHRDRCPGEKPDDTQDDTPMALPYPVDENNATAIRLAMDDLKRIHGLETAERQAKLQSELAKLTYDLKNATAIVDSVEDVEFRAENEQMVADSMLAEALRRFEETSGSSG